MLFCCNYRIDRQIGITGCALSKVDVASGDQVLISMLSTALESGKPIKFIGSGDNLDSLEIFMPENSANNLLGLKVEEKFSAADEKVSYC